jgi:hypothetical protein
MSVSDEVVHGYGVVAVGTRLPSLTGIGGASVDVIDAAPVAVIASRLPGDRFGPAIWNERADDLRWLGSLAREHERVLEQAAAVADVVPFRLPSMYSGVDALRARVADDRDLLESSLAAIAGHVEWGVKVYREAAAAKRAPTPDTGAAYLRARASELRDRDDADTELRRIVCEIHERLSRLSRDAVRNPAQDAALSGRSQPMVLNAAYLVRRDRQQDFLAEVRSLAEKQQTAADLILEPTGPWPAFNFVGRQTPKAVAYDH